MFNKFRLKVINFLESHKELPVIAALAAGLHPLFHYYNTNFSQVNSWGHLLYFLSIYIIIPVAGFVVLKRLVDTLELLKTLRPFTLSVLNLTSFIVLLLLSTTGLDAFHLSVGLIVGVLLGLLLRKHINKIIVFQLLLAAFVAVKLIPDVYKHFTHSNEWMVPVDDIASVQFKKKPNIYIIQPDGYANFSELKNSIYKFDNTAFEEFLSERNFKTYGDFRSNYNTTLSSNTSMFGMKHHYYHSPKPGANELYNARNLIVGNNPVVSALKANDYNSFLILETPYLLLNRPKIAYDYCNISYDEVPFLSRGFDLYKDVNADLKEAIMNNSKTHNFYFIEKISPGHVANTGRSSEGMLVERAHYLENLNTANTWLMDLVTTIETNDKNSLIVIVADHGGFVGLDHTLQARAKQTDRDLIYSIYTSALAIKWPEDASGYDTELKSNVNLFRVLFSYLSENSTYLNNLEADYSYAIIDKGAPFGVYKVIDDNDKVTFDVHKD
ncbi:hypothetical protein SAMN04515667_1248 [Formosa sp. Hel1_31_208]|uniref:hypothetical protein n=1 Tax=Formosa sp. Hel1_31_208 TaxID=1798225 RepID=UPI00087ABC2A|nr:hypothetical protein [Formosa sp. Hel1_31_208]SDS02956.1 hypothetical protein SAMN04515667_1248 [Formosa sp. Hel1_31_208]